MNSNKQKSIYRGRDAENGRFIPIQKAKDDPKHTVIEKIPLPIKKKRG